MSYGCSRAETKEDYNGFVCRFFSVALFVEYIQAAPLNMG
jgi:hypothetical protein